MEPGDYVHFPLWCKQLKEYVTHKAPEKSEFKIVFNIDGIPLANNTKYTAYPILAKIMDLEKVFTIGIYCTNGESILPPTEIFLGQFLKVIQNELHNGSSGFEVRLWRTNEGLPEVH